MDKIKTLLYEGVPKEISELNSLHKKIEDFKSVHAIPILLNYFEEEFKPLRKGKIYQRFKPEKEETDERRNFGLFSTAVCLEIISSFKLNEIRKESQDKIKSFFDCKHQKNFFEFIIKGLNKDFTQKRGDHEKGVKPNPLAILTCLSRLGNYYQNSEHKEELEKFFINENIKVLLSKLFTDSINYFESKLLKDGGKVHPFIWYKFLTFINKWEDVIKSICKDYNTFDSNKGEKNQLFNFFFNKIAPFAENDLHRQMSLNLSDDMALYDPKRLIYALLTVYLKNTFSNHLIRNKALVLIFETQKKNSNSLWPTGQLLSISVDSLMSVTSIECAYDLLGHEDLFPHLSEFFPELKAIYDWLARTIQTKDDIIVGWVPHDQPDKPPSSFVSAFGLGFIKRFCKLISYRMKEKAECYFRINYRETDKGFKNLYDNSAIKSKLRLMIPNKRQHSEIKSAIIFGPPGTGKTSYARALATELQYKYLELTPSDFFSGEKSSGSIEGTIVENINSIFQNLLHLKDTVVFIDEIDELVKTRKTTKKDAIYDPRHLYVTSLLPRFQELRDKGNIIFILATNHFENVDDAIARLGRIDFVIPVGHMSMICRLKYFINNLNVPNNDNKNNIDLYKAVLENTQFFNFGKLKQLVDNLKKDEEIKKLSTLKTNLQALNKEYTKDPDLKELKKFANETFEKIRPTHNKNDFCDYEALENDEVTCEKVIELFNLLQNCQDISIDSAEKINQGIEHVCRKKYYNIISSFYDDFEELLANCKEKKILDRLKSAFKKIEDLIYDRKI